MPAEQWYDNKELYEMISGLKSDMAETRRVIKEYNELRRTLNTVVVKVTELEKHAQWKKEVGDNIRLWGGWIVAILVLVWAIIARLFF